MIDEHTNLTGRFSIQMEPDLKNWLKERGKLNSRSLSGEIVERLRRSREEDERAAAARVARRRRPK